MIERVLTWFEVLGYTVLLQSDIVSGQHQSILQNYRNGILGDRFRQAMQQINPTASPQQIESVFQELTTLRSTPILQQNHQWHLQLLNGIATECSVNGSPQCSTLQLVDFANLLNNDWLVIHSFPVVEADQQHCLDLVVFINGLPLAVFQGPLLQEGAWSFRAAYLQLQTRKEHLPKFFSFNELLVLSNGVQSRVGTLTTQCKQFVPIRSVNGEADLFAGETGTEALIQGIFDKQRFFEILQHFIIFRQSRTKLTLTKKLRSHSFCTITSPRSVQQGNRYCSEVNGNN